MDTENEVFPVGMEETVFALLGDDKPDPVSVPVFLDLAKDAVLKRLYPFDPSKTWEDTAGRYDLKACEIAVYLIAKQGAEGELQHSENGTSRSYESGGIPKSMLAGIVPNVGIPR